MSNIFATAVATYVWNKSVLNRNADSRCSLGMASQGMQTFRKFDHLSRNTRRIRIFCKYSRRVIPCCEDIYTNLHAKYPSTALLEPSVTVDFRHALASAIAKERKWLIPSSPPAILICFLLFGRNAASLLREGRETRDVLKNMSSTREINAKFVSEEMGWENERGHKGIRLAIKRHSIERHLISKVAWLLLLKFSSIRLRFSSGPESREMIKREKRFYQLRKR